MKQKKKRYLIPVLSMFLLGILIAAQVVTATPLKKTKVVVKSGSTLKGTSGNSNYFDVTGKALSVTEAEKVQKLLNSIKSTEKFGVYANKIDRTNHIEGNVYANEVADSSNFVLTRVSEKQEGDFSYIGKSDESIQLSDGEKILLGPGIKVSKPNGNQTIINGGYSNNITAISLTDEETNKRSLELSNKLEEIAQVGEAAKNKIDTSFYGDSTNAFESVNNLLKKPTVTTGDAITITGGAISINVDYKQLLNNEGAFGNLINNNPGVRIIVNVIFTDTPSDINIMKAFSKNTNVGTEFHRLSPYIIWNFGNYSGNITISEEMLGIIVAPKATVYQAAGNLNGQIISNVAGNNGELHQVTVTPDVPSIPGVPDEPQKPDTPEPSEKPEEPKTTEEPEKPDTPDKPKPSEEPEKPDTPEPPKPTEEPEKPNTPDNPKPSEEPEKPNTPDNPKPSEKPEEPKTPDTPETTSETKNGVKNGSKPQSQETSKNGTINEKTPEQYAPKTGDNSYVFYSCALVIAFLVLAGLIYCIFATKNKKNK